MADNRLLSTLQHAIQHPAGHLDRYAQFGPAFEMADDQLAKPQQPPVDAPGTDGADGAQLADSSIRAFVLAGKAIFTLQGLTTRYTYRVRKSDPKPGSQYTQAAYFVSLLTGSDNTSDYTYVGLLTVSSGTIKITRASQFNDQSAPVRAFNWAMGRIWRGVSIEPARFYHVGRCGRCGRALTVPSSIETGLGPECAGKVG